MPTKPNNLVNPSTTTYTTNIKCSPQDFVNKLNQVINRIKSHHFVIKNFDYNKIKQNYYQLKFQINYRPIITPAKFIYQYLVAELIDWYNHYPTMSIVLLLNSSYYSTVHNINKILPGFQDNIGLKLNMPVNNVEKELTFLPKLIDINSTNNAKSKIVQQTWHIIIKNTTFRNIHVDNYYKAYLYETSQCFIKLEPKLKNPSIIKKLKPQYNSLIHKISQP